MLTTISNVYFATLASFRPETALFRNLFVNLRNFLCDVPRYVSAQFLDFLDLAKNCSFLARKLAIVHRGFLMDNSECPSRVYSCILASSQKLRSQFGLECSDHFLAEIIVDFVYLQVS